MKILLDTGVWFRFFHNLPLNIKLESHLKNQQNKFFLSSYSIFEISYKVIHKKLNVAHPDLWLEESLENIEVISVDKDITIQAAAFPWIHGDPGDRLITATAKMHGLILVHTDKVLRDLTGFGQEYFSGTE